MSDVFFPPKKPKKVPASPLGRLEGEARAVENRLGLSRREFVLVAAILVLFFAVVGLALRPSAIPGPGPGPAPHPHPAPVVGTIWVTLVHDSENPTQSFAQLEADPGLGVGLNSLGAHLRNFDIKSHVLDDKHLRPYIERAGGPPVLIVQGEGTEAVKAVKCPETAVGVLAEVRKFKGGK